MLKKLMGIFTFKDNKFKSLWIVIGLFFVFFIVLIIPLKAPLGYKGLSVLFIASVCYVLGFLAIYLVAPKLTKLMGKKVTPEPS